MDKSQSPNQNLKPRIMIVEDDGLIAARLQEILTRNGYVSAAVSSGEEAIEQVAETRPDLALMDIRLAGQMDGIETAEQIRARFDVPIIYLSAYTDKALLQRAKMTEPHSFLVKPVQKRELLATVETALHKHQTEKKLRASEEHFRSVAQTAHDAIITIDHRGAIVYWNPEAEALFGYTADEAAGQSLIQIVPERFREAHQKGIRRVVSTGETNIIGKTIELAGLRRDGQEFPLELSLARWKTGEGDFFTAIIRDITERKQADETLKAYSEQLEEMVEERTKELQEAQEQLLRREKLAVLGQLAGSVAHELRNPLGVLSNAAYFLQMTLSDADETTTQYLEMISSQIYKSEKIISDLLDFSRIRPAERAEREEVAVSTLVAQVLAEQSSPEQVEVSTQIPSNLPPVFVDPQQIGQVLTNLVTNAYQAMPDGGKLTIKTSEVFRKPPRSGWVSISVTDTGSGISPENMKKLFEPLFTTKARGIGLGLVVTKNLVEANGGIIEVESEGVPGKGSAFTVKLPLGGRNGE